jgi:hypothetical protein
LDNVVPEGIRDYFERIRNLHLYGVLEYGFFSAAGDLRLFAIEAALRVRFVGYYSGHIPAVARGKKVAGAADGLAAVTTRGAEATLLVANFEDVWRAAHYWDLGPVTGGHTMRMPTTLETLLTWARGERLLPGRRTRFVDQALVRLRNWAAHPTDYSLQMPPESARGLLQAAEMINKLWGVDTLDGRLFSGPVTREARVVAIDPDGGAASLPRLDQVPTLDAVEQRYKFAVLLAAPEEELLRYGGDTITVAYREGLQTTRCPCEQLFLGSWEELMTELGSGSFDGVEDSVQVLDRMFLVCVKDSRVEPARSPDDVVALAEPVKGEWFAIVADSPFDAYAHVSQHRTVAMLSDGSCPECFVEAVGPLTWDSMLDHLRSSSGPGTEGQNVHQAEGQL